MEVSHKCVWSSWTIAAEALSEISKGQVRDSRIKDGLPVTDLLETVKQDDILCLLESEREARRLR